MAVIIDDKSYMDNSPVGREGPYSYPFMDRHAKMIQRLPGCK